MKARRRSRRRMTRFWIFTVLLSTGCAECAPGLVAEGVGRLTVRNAGAILQLVNEDDVCGFLSADVLAQAKIEGEIGKQGRVTHTVRSCEINLQKSPQVTTDCRGIRTTIGGRLTISAKRTVHGTVSGDPINPVVPSGPDAVKIEISVEEFRGFYVSTNEDDNQLAMLRGELSFVAKPRLARSLSSGVCAIATPNIEISKIKYTNAHVNVQSGGRDFNVPIANSQYWAVNGTHGARSNAIGGTMTVWGHSIELDEEDGLNPEHDVESFVDAFACTEDLQMPVDFACDGIEPVLAQGVSRLTIQTFGMLTKVIEEDELCGFSSPNAQASSSFEGEIGKKGAVVTTVNECMINFAVPTVLQTDCAGVDTVVSGRVIVSANKRIEGRLTGQLQTPVVPMRDDPAIITISNARFEDFQVRSNGNGLTVHEGWLSGQVQPRVAKDFVTGACSVETGIARFNALRWEEAQLTVASPAGKFITQIASSDLQAVNGSWGPDSNVLRGTIVLGDEVFTLPTRIEDDGLNPDFDANTFDDAWTCKIAQAEPSFDCHFVEPIAQGASQLSVKMLGTIAAALESDTQCGFGSPDVTQRAQLIGDVGRPNGQVIFSVQNPCDIVFNEPTLIETDCHGTQTYVQGRVRARGRKSISGHLTGHPVEAAVPGSTDAVQIGIDAEFHDFEVWMEPGGQGIKIHSGGLKGTLAPQMAVDTIRGACALPTPIAEFNDIQYQNADLTITSEGMKFRMVANDSALRAQNGSNHGVTNFLQGVIKIDGESLNIPSPGKEPILDPNYEPGRFLQSFSCNENLRLAQSDAECSLDKTIAEGAARLLIQSVGAVTTAVNKDDDCGFESNLTDPDQVFGSPGQLGMIAWSIGRCAITRALDRLTRPVSEDCIGGNTYYEGEFVADARREVQGIRSDIVIFILRFFSIAPHNRDAVDIFLDRVEFNNFKAYATKASEVSPSRALTIHSGFLSAHVHPIMGENDDDRGTYDIPTPIARMRTVRLIDAPITLYSEGMTFVAHIDSAEFYAFNGAYQGERNAITGTIVVDGKTFQILDQDLDPDYNQQQFDASYACTDDLRALVPPF
jgi:hypothetical protein